MQSVVRESIVKSQLAGYGGAPSLPPDADATIAADALPSSDAATILAGGSRASRTGGRPSTRSSDANSFVGTIDYMSPEVRDGRGAADARSDVFAVGIIAYQLLTGSKPRGIRPRMPSQIVKGLSPKWDQWINKCTEQDPGDRFQSAGEALKALPHAGGGGRRGLPLLAIAAGAAALVAAVGAGWFFGVHLPQVRLEREKAVQAENARKAEEARIAAEKARAEAAAKAEAARLEAARGGAIIRTTPPGAQVLFGAVAVENSPCTIKDLKLGKYPVRVRLPGYDNWDGEAVVLENDFAEVDVVLTRQSGVLAVTSNPPGLTAVVTCTAPEGGAAKPADTTVKTPAKLTLPTGDYSVEFRRDNFLPAKESVRVAKGSAAEAGHAFPSGGLTLTSHLEGAYWTILSAPETSAGLVGNSGSAPATLADLPTGEYSIDFAHDGWANVTRRVTVAAGVTGALDAAFPVGQVRIQSTPDGADVCDEEDFVIGTAPLTLTDLAPGAVKYILRLNGHRDAEVSGLVKDGETLRLSATLEELPKAPVAGSDWTVPDAQVEMIWVGSGTFTMGSPENEMNHEGDEAQHSVTLTKGFWLGKYEVTQSQWEAVMGNNPSRFAGKGNLPVERVSWNDAIRFCRRLTQVEREAGRLPEGYAYDLPTEAQWEYACRAGEGGPYSGGSLTDVGWYSGNAGGSTQPAGSKRTNAWGFYDMHGNVWEWVHDWYSTGTTQSLADPEGPETGNWPVERGGGWNSGADQCRSAKRFIPFGPEGIDGDLGFRLALRPVGEIAPENAALPGEDWTVPEGGIVLKWIFPGSFQMGSPESEPGRDGDETPHRVTITSGFWIGQREVTQGEWKAVTGRSLRDQVVLALKDDNLYSLGGTQQTNRGYWNLSADADPAIRMGVEEDNYPIYFVSWEDAVEFCRLLTEKEQAAGRLPEGYAFTLPTEAQWEYACRAGTTTATYAGELPIAGLNNAPVLDAIAWYGGNSSVGYDGRGWDTSEWKEKQYPGGYAAPRSVCLKKANEWGLFDIEGNVNELCLDWYGAYPAGDAVDPTGSASGGFRIIRGGSWQNEARRCRAAMRMNGEPGVRNNNTGLRLALTKNDGSVSSVPSGDSANPRPHRSR
jgi:formylglycine-generating enzyme required for sulfatase activity